MFMTVRVAQSSPFPVGDYQITYNIKDGSTGKSFQLVNSVKVANIVTPGAISQRCQAAVFWTISNILYLTIINSKRNWERVL